MCNGLDWYCMKGWMRVYQNRKLNETFGNKQGFFKKNEFNFVCGCMKRKELGRLLES